MSWAALSAEATHWNVQVLGRGVEVHAGEYDGGEKAEALFHDVNDPEGSVLLEVGESYVRHMPFERPRTWKLVSSELPTECHSPLWLPSELLVSREVRAPAGILIDGHERVTLRAAPAQIEAKLRRVRPGARPMTVCWSEPLVNVSLPLVEALLSPEAARPHVGGIVMGPKLQASLQRGPDGKLRLIELDGAPDGIEEVAARMFETTLAEMEEAKAQAVAEAAEAAKKEKTQEKAIIVFGKKYRPGDRKKADECPWDTESECFAFWSAMQQWERSVRRQPWRWRLHAIESHGLKDGGLTPVSGSVSSGSARKSRKGGMVSPRKSSPGRMASPRKSSSARKSSKVGCAGTPKTPKPESPRPSPRFHPSRQGLRTEELRALLRGFDQDRSGSIDWPEFRDISSRLVDLLGTDGHWTEEAARQEFEALDVNGNGVIEEQEWLMFVGEVLSILGHSEMKRVLALLGQDMSAFTTRTTTVVQGDVDVGLACKKGHAIRPLRLSPWGEQLARSLGLAGGFRCAAVDDPIIYEAAWRQRCTHCNAVDSQATFSVTCVPCGKAFDSGWWCTKCIMKDGHPRNHTGKPVSVVHRHRSGACRYCAQPAIIAWPVDDTTEDLCNDHAADKLLEEAARCCAAGGREPLEGPSLAVSMNFELSLECEDMDDEGREEFAHELEQELCEVLSLEGAPPEPVQLEVVKFSPGRKSSDVGCTQVQLVMTRAFGRPSPHELFLRFRGHSVDLDGPMYNAEHYDILSSLTGLPEAADVLVTDADEQIEMTSRVAHVVAESWPHGGSPSRTLLVARPPKVLLPHALVLSLRCLKPPEGAGGRLLAYALAYPVNARKTQPAFHDYKAYLDPDWNSGDIPVAPKASAKSSGRRSSNVGRSSAKSPRQTRSRSTKGRQGGKRNGTAAPAIPAAGTVVCLIPSPGSGPESLQGEATLLGLKPGREYDVYVAIFENLDAPATDVEAAYQPPIASMKKVLRTCTERPFGFFGADVDGVVQVQTEDPDVKRKACFLELLGLGSAPCVIDHHTCKVSVTPAGRDSKDSKEVMREHSIDVILEEAVSQTEDPAMAGGLQLKTPVFVAQPSHYTGEAGLELTVSADVCVMPCQGHLFSGNSERPLALSLHGRTTEARCVKPSGDEVRCAECRFVKVTRKHNMRARVAINIKEMAENRDWASVRKRSDVVPHTESRGALAEMIAATPPLDSSSIMTLYEACVGRRNEIHCAVRGDGATALHVAVEENHMDVAKLMLARNMDPACTNAMGETPLHAAARGGSGMAPDLAQMLLDSAASTWRGDEHIASGRARAKQALLDKQDNNGRTVLHLAASSEQLALMRCLLNARADARLLDSSGHNALHLAAAAGVTESVAELLRARICEVDCPTGDARACTALHLASQRCNAEVAMLLLGQRADPQTTTSHEGKPRHVINLLMEGVAQWAAFKGIDGVVEVAQQVMARGSPPKSLVTQAGASICGFTLWASKDDTVVRCVSMLLALLERGGLDRPAALGLAVLDSVRAATSSSSAGDRRDDRRVTNAQTPGAAASELPDAVNLALQLGANPNTTDAKGDSALHLLLRHTLQRRVLPNDQVAGTAIAQTIKVLLESRANLNASNKRGEKPLMLAKKWQDQGSNYNLSWSDVISPSKEVSPSGALPAISSPGRGGAAKTKQSDIPKLPSLENSRQASGMLPTPQRSGRNGRDRLP